MKSYVYLVVLALIVAGCAGPSTSHLDEAARVTVSATTLSSSTVFSRDQLWSAALESFSLDQKGVRGRLGLVPHRVRVGSEESEIPGLEMATNWYEADSEMGMINTRWLDIPPGDRGQYCNCAKDEALGMVTTSVKLDVFVKAQEAGSSMDVSSTFRQYKDNPAQPGKGKTTPCESTEVLERALIEMISERAGGHQ